jgi:hypothetical protein
MQSEPIHYRFRIYAHRDQKGEVTDSFLIATDQGLALWNAVDQQDPLPIPTAALSAVFSRYGKPLEEGLDVTPVLARDDADDEPLLVDQPNGQSAKLERFRFLPFGWVHPEDYLLWTVFPSENGTESIDPLAAPAALIYAALIALGQSLGKSGK